jgi:hypothetical protein
VVVSAQASCSDRKVALAAPIAASVFKRSRVERPRRSSRVTITVSQSSSTAEGFIAEGFNNLVEVEQLERHDELQILVAVRVEWMVVERAVHLSDRAAVLVGNAPQALVQDQIPTFLVHRASLPLPPLFANADAPLEVVRHGLQMAEQFRFLVEDRRDQPLMESTAAAAPDAHRQRREGLGFAVAQLAA